MKIKAFIVVCGLLVLGACVNRASQPVEASVDSKFKVVGRSNVSIVGALFSTEIVDSETGVHYLIVSDYRAEGGIGITPVYNADGTLKTN